MANNNRNIMAEIQAAAEAGEYAKAAKLEQERNAVVKANTAADPNYKWANDYTTQYAQYLGSDYTAKGTNTDSGLSAADMDLLNTYKTAYNNAASLGDEAGKQAAHAAAEALRAQYGYSGGTDGSEYIAKTGVMPTYSYDVAQPTYTSNYSSRIDEMLNQILNRDAFNYNAESDPLFQQYKTQYNREGNRSMNDTLAAAASQAGGMNSYAMTAAQQANNYYASQLTDKIPELYQLAYDMYLTDIDQQVRDLGLLQDMDNTQYNRYRDTMSDWRDDRNFTYDKYRDDMYDYKWNTEFDYNVGRDSLSDTRYNSETLGQYGDFSGYKDLGYTDEQIANMQNQYNKEDSKYYDETTYDQALKKAQTLAQYGDFSGYKALGYTDEEIAAMKKAYDKAVSGGDPVTPTKDDVISNGTGLTEGMVDTSNVADNAEMWAAIHSLGIGSKSATLVNELITYGAIEEVDGKLVWANGWNAENYERLLNTARANGGDLFPTYLD